MKKYFLLILCTLPIHHLMSQSNPLESYKWKNRLLVIYSPDAGNKDFLVQHQNYKNAIEDYKKRDLLVFHLINNSFSSLVETNKSQFQETHLVKDRLEISQNQQFQVFLIGKDGGVKLRSDKPISNEKLFNLIDSMPMRQNEMRKDADNN